MVYLGIDPGSGGAAVFIDAPAREIVDACDAPSLKRMTMLADLSDKIKRYEVAFAAIESPIPAIARPQRGEQAKHVNYGICVCLCHMAGVPWAPVRPGTWKKALGLSRDKDASMQAVSEILPGGLSLRKRRHDYAEAALLAWYAYKTLRLLRG